ncbi:MAG: hypothetical protein PHH23_01855 [Paludibacteraceae bacterium]|nr:hypothetical protein [Paludibacteraceae bacterium]
MERIAQLNCVIGGVGCGKTTIIKQISATQNRQLIVVKDYSTQGWENIAETKLQIKSDYIFTGSRKYIWKDNTSIQAIANFRKGIIILDDCRCYLDSLPSKEIKQIFSMRRHRETDVFAVTHSFKEMPPIFFEYADNFIIFQSVGSVEIRKKEIGDAYPIIKEISDDVNLKSIDNPHYFRIVNRKQATATILKQQQEILLQKKNKKQRIKVS